MTVYVWQQEMDPGFPLAVLEYAVHGDTDPMHWHDHLEIALVLEGRGQVRFGQRAIEASRGDVFFIDNSQPHVAHAAPDTTLRLLLVLFRPELVAGPGCRELDRGYLASFRLDEGGASPRVRGSSALGARLAATLGELRDTWETRDPADRLFADATLRRVLALAGRRAETPPVGAHTASDRRERIRPVLSYINLHCHEAITLDDVAQVAHVSPSRVRHVFKDVTGVSFKEYVTQVRLAEAKRLLLATDASVAEIAGAVSYSNLNQFYKVFHRSCAMSPGEYRRYYTPAGQDGVASTGR